MVTSRNGLRKVSDTDANRPLEMWHWIPMAIIWLN